jgi:death-on-curing protein
MPRWLPEAAVRAMHAALMAEHGGLDGPVDEDMLGATLARPRQFLTYSSPPATLYQLAAAYGFGFARNHCFADGNKRISLAAIDVFLQLNGYELTAQETEAVIIIEDVAAGEISEDDLAHWIEANISSFEI